MECRLIKHSRTSCRAPCLWKRDIS